MNRARVALLRVLSSAVVFWLAVLSPAQAHEILPSIADMRVVDGEIRFEVRANLESFVAGINLTEVSETNASIVAATYDELRALPPDALAERFAGFWPQMARSITLAVDGAAVLPELRDVRVDPVGDVALVRASVFSFAAELPEGAQMVKFGWGPEFGVLVLRQMDVPEPYDGYLEAGALSAPINLSGGGQISGLQTFLDYVPVGLVHIVPKGLDHILFVLGLFFLAARFRPLLLQVSLFTLAHTLTLALAALGYTAFIDDFTQSAFGIPFIGIVEPLIALSIAYVAIENIFMKGISHWRPYVIFLFGLLHGLGFASVLTQFGLPEDTFVSALIGFNVGVEIGQLTVILVMLLCVFLVVRIDRGANDIILSYVIYTGMLVLAVVLIALNPAGLARFLGSHVWLFAGPLAGVILLAMVAIHFRNQQEAYRRIVAVPASVAIATVGIYWFVGRVFL